MLPQERRRTAYGLFMAVFGPAWLVGSAVQGKLYDVTIPGLVASALIAQTAGAMLICIAARIGQL